MGTHGPIRYRFNADFFHTIDTDEKAYWLGFLAADGGVVRTTLVLTLATADRAHLEAFRVALKADQPVQHYAYPHNRLDFVSIRICSKPFCENLAQYGIVPRKTWTLRFPNLPPCYIAAFIRGYFDGDGSIFSTTSTAMHGRYKTVRDVVTICGNHEFLVELQKYLPIPSRLRKHKSIWDIRIDTWKNLKQFSIWIYAGATIWLPRKRQRLEALLIIRECAFCGIQFVPMRFKLRGKYCSKACYQRAFRHSFSWKTERSCRVCHAPFLPQTALHALCSLKCRRRWSYLHYGC